MKKYKKSFRFKTKKNILFYKDISRMPAVIDDNTGDTEYPSVWKMKKKDARKEINKFNLIHSS